MALPYVKPGVAVSEIVSPQLTPTLLDPNVLAIVGPGRGYEEHVEVFVLVDNTPVTLAANNPDPTTIVVRDASDVTLTPFTQTVFNATPSSDILADYEVDTTDLLTNGTVDIVRSMQTTIENGEEVVIYYETSLTPDQPDSETVFETLNLLTPVTMTQGSVGGLVPASLTVARKGNLVAGTDFALANEGGPTPTIVWDNGSLRISQYQTVYLDFDIGATSYTDQPVQLDELTPVSLPATADNIVVKTAPGTFTTNALVYDISTTEEEDYTLTGSGATTAIARSQGSTTIGGSNDQLAVRVSYRATPSDYYLPTRCFSQNDVETKFGSPFDSLGNVINPLSLATLFAFQNGASQIVAQALFSGTAESRQAPDGALGNWELSFESLQVVQDISLITPVIAAGNLSTPVTDSLNLSILQTCQAHLRYMAAQENQFIMGIFGEDGTNGTLATTTVLRGHGDALGAGDPSEAVVLLTPSSYTFTNPVTGLTQDIGGQYVAAGVAGMCSRYPVQMPLTRKRINNLTSLKVTRTETQKDQDAQSGLCVVENKRGRIQVRHSITTNQDTRAQQELSVVRAKYWMMKNLVEVLDTQAVGTLILDAEANFSIQVLVAAQLELLVQQGAIVSYDNIQVRPDPNDATALQVRFSYLPAYPLNHITISFSISAQQGVEFDQATTTQGF